jgi:hypothetical protein
MQRSSGGGIPIGVEEDLDTATFLKNNGIRQGKTDK